jgi:heat shock protein HslJ
MNSSIKTLLLAAAGTGLMSGTTTVQPVTLPAQNGSASMARVGLMPMTLNQNATPKHDCKGMNQCKGQGGCNTGDMGCKAKNSCKGKGGCKTNTP